MNKFYIVILMLSCIFCLTACKSENIAERQESNTKEEVETVLEEVKSIGPNSEKIQQNTEITPIITTIITPIITPTITSTITPSITPSITPMITPMIAPTISQQENNTESETAIKETNSNAEVTPVGGNSIEMSEYEIVDRVTIYNQNEGIIDDETLNKDLDYRFDIEESELNYIQSQDYTYYVTDENKKEISIAKISNVTENIVIPNEIDGYQVVALGMLYDSFSTYEEEGYPIDDYRVIAVEDLDKVINIYIPEGVKYIGTNAFRDMKQLKTITLPTSLLEIYSNAFMNDGIEELELPINLQYISNIAFGYCINLKKVNIRSKQVRFSDEYPPFKSCNILTEVVWDNVDSINMDGFRLTYSLERMVIPPSVKNVLIIDNQLKKLIIAGNETEIIWDDGYNYSWNKDLIAIIPKGAVAISTLKKLHVVYEEVELPELPNVTIKTNEIVNARETVFTWDDQDKVEGYQIYYSTTKDGEYTMLDEIVTTTYTITNQTGYVVLRGYKIYQGERWYSRFARVKL